MPWTLIIMVVMMIISTIISLAFAKTPNTPDATPSTIQDFQFPQISEGTAQTVVFGDVWLKGWQVLWYGNLTVENIHASSAHGKS